jgi:hypothetical protein
VVRKRLSELGLAPKDSKGEPMGERSQIEGEENGRPTDPVRQIASVVPGVARAGKSLHDAGQRFPSGLAQVMEGLE